MKSKTKCYAKLKCGESGCLRLFEVLGYDNGLYAVYIDFVFHMPLNTITVKEVMKDE